MADADGLPPIPLPPPLSSAVAERPPQPSNPPFDAAMNQALAPVLDRLDRIEARLARVERTSNISFNWQVGAGEGMRFQEVAFADGSNPTDAPYALPPLTTADAVVNLNAEDRDAYYRGYYPQGRLPLVAERTKKIMRAIGCRRP